MDLTGVPLGDPHRTSIIISTVCGLLSGVTTVGLFVYLFWSAYGWRYNGPQNGFRSFLHTDAGQYLISLLLADLCHCIGYSVGLRWIVAGKVHGGTACSFQAAFLQLGDMGTVIWVLAISVHTLIHLFLSKRPPSWLAPTILTAGWIITVLLPIIGPYAIADKEHPFYDGSSGMWCWVSNAYPRTQVLYFFVWAMVSLAVSIICYTLVYLRTAGYISGGRFAPAMPRPRGRKSSRWACTGAFVHESGSGDTEPGPRNSSGGTRQHQANRPRVDPKQKIGRDVRRVARMLLLYPLAYAVLVMPLTVFTLIVMSGGTAPLGLFVAATCTYALGGLVDSLLFIFTRRSFILNATSRSSRSRRAGGNARCLEGITVTRHELTVFDVHTLGSTPSYVHVIGNGELDSPAEDKALDRSERPFGGFALYTTDTKPDLDESGTESSPARAL